MIYNVFYRKSKDHIFGDFSANGIKVQIHVFYNIKDGRECPGTTSIEFFKCRHDGVEKLFKNRSNEITIDSVEDAAVKAAINAYFKETVVDDFAIRETFDE